MSGAGSFKITPEQLEALGGQTGKNAQDIDGLHKALESQLGPLRDGSAWSGQAAGQFNELYNKFNQSAKSLTEALNGISQLMKGAAQSYSQAEQQIASSFRD
jgi:WXG100 family type VII secretion target